MEATVEIDMDTLVMRVNGQVINDSEPGYESCAILDSITPRQAFAAGRQLGYLKGLRDGIAINDE